MLLLRLATLSLAFLLAACVYVPAIDNQATQASNCQTFTQQMTLKEWETLKEWKSSPSKSPTSDHLGRGPDCVEVHVCGAVLATAIVVTAGSALVSGSIVVVNNTAHWLEYQGTCSDSYLNQVKQNYFDSFGNPTLPPAPAPN